MLTAFLVWSLVATVSAERDPVGLFPMVENNKWGYIDRTGKVVIPPRFDLADYFYEGRALVLTGKQTIRLPDSEHEIVIGKWGYIDVSGKFVIPPKFGNGDSFSEGLAEVSVDGRWGFIDRAGEFVIEPQYYSTQPFSEGLAIVRREMGEPFLVVDKTGKVLFEVPYPWIGAFSDGHAVFSSKDNSNKSGYIDRSGNQVTPAVYGSSHRFSDGLAAVWLDGKMGYIDKEGRTAIAFKFELAGDFSEGMAPACVETGCGFIDKNGRFVIDPRFFDAEPFKNGYARVYDENGKVGFIDRSGKVVIEPQFEEAEDFIDGLAEIREGDPVSYLLGYIDTSGHFVWKLKKSLK